MKKTEIYIKDYCPFCHRAKDLLRVKRVDFVEYDVTNDVVKEKEMQERSGQTTVPQIFVDDVLLGGCTDLFDLEETGTLDETLGL